jgi:hypothetical protein
MYPIAGFLRYIRFTNIISVAGFSTAALISVLSPWLGWRYKNPPVQRPPSLTHPLACLSIECTVLFSLLFAYLCSRLSLTLYTSNPWFSFLFPACMRVVFTPSFCGQVPALYSAKHLTFLPLSQTGITVPGPGPKNDKLMSVAGSWIHFYSQISL